MMEAPLKNLPRPSSAGSVVTVLAVSPREHDHVRLRTIFSHSNWKIYQAVNCQEAVAFLKDHCVSVLVSERDLPDGGWKRLLEFLSSLPLPPLLVVTAEDSDDSLWAEALNLGAYDVLSKPFDRAEVTRIISLAWLHWKEETVRARDRKTSPAAA